MIAELLPEQQSTVIERAREQPNFSRALQVEALKEVQRAKMAEISRAIARSTRKAGPTM